MRAPCTCAWGADSCASHAGAGAFPICPARTRLLRPSNTRDVCVCAWRVLRRFVRKYESGGVLWPSFHRRVVACLLISAVFLACVMMVKRAYVQVRALHVRMG